LPHAIGAQLAYPNRQVISMAGDGGLGMLLGELLTVSMYQLPVKIVVFNNGALGERRVASADDPLRSGRLQGFSSNRAPLTTQPDLGRHFSRSRRIAAVSR